MADGGEGSSFSTPPLYAWHGLRCVQGECKHTTYS